MINFSHLGEGICHENHRHGRKTPQTETQREHTLAIRYPVYYLPWNRGVVCLLSPAFSKVANFTQHCTLWAMFNTMCHMYTRYYNVLVAHRVTLEWLNSPLLFASYRSIFLDIAQSLVNLYESCIGIQSEVGLLFSNSVVSWKVSIGKESDKQSQGCTTCMD